MNTLYNQIAGQSVERLPVRRDAIFAVVMTLMVARSARTRNRVRS